MTCEVRQHGTDTRSTVLPTRPLATSKAASCGKLGSSSGKCSRRGSQRRVLGVPPAPVAVASAVGLPVLILCVIGC